jgi:hypothetical protein
MVVGGTYHDGFTEGVSFGVDFCFEVSHESGVVIIAQE